jgi:hypothetical protein
MGSSYRFGVHKTFSVTHLPLPPPRLERIKRTGLDTAPVRPSDLSTLIAAGLAVKCPSCGASLDLSPDTVVYVCRYCGWSGFVTKEEISIAGVLPMDMAALRSSTEDFLRKRTGASHTVTEQKLVLAPFWLVKSHNHTKYNGYRRETRSRTTGSGKNQHTEVYVVYRPVKGVMDDDEVLSLFARRHERMFALEGAEDVVRRSSPAQYTADQLKGLGKVGEFLSSSIGLDEAKHWAETKVFDMHRSKVEGMCTKVFDCYTDVSVLAAQLVFYPLYIVRFENKGRTFRLLTDASNGRVIEAEVPLTAAQRVGFLLAGYGSAAALGAASFAILSSTVVENALAYALLIGGVALGLASATTILATRAERHVRGS